MIPPGSDPSPVQGWRRLGWLSLFGGTCAVAGGVYLFGDGGIRCPFLVLTGLQCPVCGATRMAAAVLRGDLAAAWLLNPFMLLLGTLLLLWWIWTAVRLLVGRPVALPTPVGGWLEARTPTQWLALVLVPGLLWGLARNLI